MSIVLQPVDLSLDGWVPTTLQADNAEQGKGVDAHILDAPIKKLTTERLDGSGVFDVLMRATKVHLAEEYDNNRITGAEYATVYLGALTAVLQNSIQYMLSEHQIRKLHAEIGLVRQQTITELAQTDDNLPIGLGFNFVPKGTVSIPPVGGN